MSKTYNIEISNCNNIEIGEIELLENNLNIKYGINGTGKSTIAKALELSINDKSKLINLLPFKLQKDNPKELSPMINGLSDVSSIKIFNEEYINTFVYKNDELIENSFEIFIQTDEYKEKLAKIEDLVSEIRSTFRDNEELETITSDLDQLVNCFGKSKKGYSAASSIAKGLGNGNKIVNIPENLKEYSSFITSEQPMKWVKWQSGGNEFLNISNKCPYCTAPTKDKRKTIEQVSIEYKAKDIEHLLKVIEVIESLKKYFSSDALEKIKLITSSNIGISAEGKNYLGTIKNDCSTLRDKLVKLKSISYFSFEQVDEIKPEIESLKIHLELLPNLKSEMTESIVESLNNCLNELIKKSGTLQGKVAQQKISIKRTIEENKRDINEFLLTAGYSYNVDIQGDSSNYKLILSHNDNLNQISNGRQHLSFGEKNAFALVLFMYDCISENTKLIILDDPISSFDKNKKFAILDRLFLKKKSLKGKTVLMLTHDFEPIIDIIKNGVRLFHPKPKASFISTKNGVLTESEILNSDILSFSQICNQNIGRSNSTIIKCIYLRRHFETLNDIGMEYQLLSSVLHKREVPDIRTSAAPEPVAMTKEQIQIATYEIQTYIEEFEYLKLLEQLSDNEKLITLYTTSQSYYEKLQIFRLIVEIKDVENSNLRKFINETYHIENEFISQLNPMRYNLIPEYIIVECNSYILELSNSKMTSIP